MGRRIRRIVGAVDNPDPNLAALGTDLADLWRKNILAGPNERWEAGPSKRALEQGGTTLVDTGLMFRSIDGFQSGENEVTVGSALTVGSKGYNLLALHEFGVDTEATVGPFTRRQPSRNVGKSGKLGVKKAPVAEGVAFVGPFTRHQYLPRRPTSPFDWDTESMTPEGDAVVRKHVEEYEVRLQQ